MSDASPLADGPVPEAFLKAVLDMTADLGVAFPEYAGAWARWSPGAGDADMREAYMHCRGAFAGHLFFEVLYKNAAIFEAGSGVNTEFLPGVQFRELFLDAGVSDNTREALWRHLQAVMFTVVVSPEQGSADLFGSFAERLGAAEQADVQSCMNDFLKSMEGRAWTAGAARAAEGNDVFEAAKEAPTEADGGALPAGMEGLSGLLDGKLGALAKEMAEDISADLAALLGPGEGSGADLIQRIMADPSKMLELVKSVGAKLSGKMASGEVSQDELTREAAELMQKMHGLGGAGPMKDIFAAISGLAGGARPPRAPPAPSSAPVGAGASMRDRLRAKMAQKQAQAAARTPAPAPESRKFVYSVDGAEKQAVSDIATAPRPGKKGKRGGK